MFESKLELLFQMFYFIISLGDFMDIVGIICEYNPFHNGHIYHLQKVKELFPNSMIVLIMSGNFTQRGIPSIIDKWNKTEIALTYGVDLVVELPFVFATQSADIFAKGAIQLLKALRCQYLVFGSEEDNVEELEYLAKFVTNNLEYEEKVKTYLDLGNNYPTSLNKALYDLSQKEIKLPNDLLGFSYVKEIIKQNAPMKPITIKRTNHYHNTSLDNNHISSATSIREAYQNHSAWEEEVPKETIDIMKDSIFLLENYFPFLKYKIMTSKDLSIYQTVDEGIENKLKKEIEKSTSISDLIHKLKTKRYTYNKLSRMLIHILCNFTKTDASKMKEIEYIRVLGFSRMGQNYLNTIKKNCTYPIITTFSKENSKMLAYEKIVTSVYASILPEKEKIALIEAEYKNKPKMKG